MGLQNEVLDLVVRHFGHTAQGVATEKALRLMSEEQVGDVVVKCEAGISDINDMLNEMQKGAGNTAKYPADCRALLRMTDAVDTLMKTASALGVSGPGHANVKTLNRAAEILDAVFQTQRDYVRAKRLVQGVWIHADSSDKAGDKTQG